MAPESHIGRGSRFNSTRPPKYKGSIPNSARAHRNSTPLLARFLLVMNRIENYREEDAISLFCNNCTDKGILNAISRREITRFADLASIVRKYCAMESFRKTETKFWDNPAPNTTLVRNKSVQHTQAPGAKTKSEKTLKGMEPYWRDGSTDPTKSIVQRAPLQHIAFEHVGYCGRWPKVVKSF